MQDTPYAAVLARNLRVARAAADLSQADVAERMRALGFRSWLSQTTSSSERAKRRVTAEEVVALALVLGTTVRRLTNTPDENGGQNIELPSGLVIPGRRLTSNDGSLRWDGNVPVPAPLPSAQRAAELERHSLRIRQIEDSGGEAIEVPPPVKEDALQPVANAIVTSPLGVLIGRRNDGRPPWGFIGGEVEPGEQPEFAAEREVKEETGLEVRAVRVLGERIHPKTGRDMIYIACAPTHGTDVFVGDPVELAEVKWASLAEADELLPGMFGPVHDYLSIELAEGEQ